MGTAQSPLLSHPGFRANTADRTAFLVVSAAGMPDPTMAPLKLPSPAAVAVLRVGADFGLQSLALLDAPQFRPKEIAEKFWLGVSLYGKAKLVFFRGRQFELPMLELAAFRYGLPLGDYVQQSRNRFNGPLDLSDWFTNHGANTLTGGLDELARLIGRPAGLGVRSDEVAGLVADGRTDDVNAACLCDALDTYFVFLRTRVMACEITPEQEADRTAAARDLLAARADEFPILDRYLEGWKQAA